MAPKRAPSEKMSAKSRPFSEPSENELQKWTLWNPGPADCATRLQLINYTSGTYMSENIFT